MLPFSWRETWLRCGWGRVVGTDPLSARRPQTSPLRLLPAHTGVSWRVTRTLWNTHQKTSENKFKKSSGVISTLTIYVWTAGDGVANGAADKDMWWLFISVLGVRGPELFFALPLQVSDQPVGVKGVLRGHTPAHDGVQEGLSLTCVKTEYLRQIWDMIWDMIARRR